MNFMSWDEMQERKKLQERARTLLGRSLYWNESAMLCPNCKELCVLSIADECGMPTEWEHECDSCGHLSRWQIVSWVDWELGQLTEEQPEQLPITVEA